MHVMVSAKEIWDILALTYEGLKEVKRNRLTMLKHQYEIFAIEDHESIQSMVSHFHWLGFFKFVYFIYKTSVCFFTLKLNIML